VGEEGYGWRQSGRRRDRVRGVICKIKVYSDSYNFSADKLSTDRNQCNCILSYTLTPPSGIWMLM
jgi:hypothetical protein